MNILITGKPGVGKTTLIHTVVKKYSNVSGFFTREIREGRQRVGFAIETMDGKKGVLAHITIESPFRVSKYGVNLKDIDGICVPSMDLDADIIVIDEIGKMELFSEKFKHKVAKALDTQKVIATILERPHPFTDTIKKREDVRLFTVTERNRNDLVTILKRELSNRLSERSTDY